MVQHDPERDPDPTASEAELKDGDQVEGRFAGASGRVVFYKGRISRVNHDGTYNVRFDDGDRYKNIPRRRLRTSDAQKEPVALAVGQIIDAFYQGGRKLYSGKIIGEKRGGKNHTGTAVYRFLRAPGSGHVM